VKGVLRGPNDLLLGRIRLSRPLRLPQRNPQAAGQMVAVEWGPALRDALRMIPVRGDLYGARIRVRSDGRGNVLVQMRGRTVETMLPAVTLVPTGAPAPRPCRRCGRPCSTVTRVTCSDQCRKDESRLRRAALRVQMVSG
jgi:hypothetical protein